MNFLKILICGGQWDGRLIMISTETDNIIDFYIQHIDTVTVIESDRKDNFLITGSKNGEVIYWKITAEYKLIAKYFFNDHCDEVIYKYYKFHYNDNKIDNFYIYIK